MAKVIPVGKPVNDAERQAIAHLRDNMPDNCIVLHNFEIHRNREFFEVDVALLTPHAVFLVDVKGTHGEVHVYGSKWYPEGRTPFTSPLLKLRAHARALKGMILQSGRDRRELQGVFVDAAVLLSAPNAVFEDTEGRDKVGVTTLKKCVKFFGDKERLPGHFDRNIQEYYSRILSAIQGKARAKNAPLQFGHWIVQERLGSTSHYKEYRAVNQTLGEAGGTVLLRVYRTDPYLPEDLRKKQMLRITNAYRSLASVPTHPSVVDERDFFATEGDEHFVLVTEDPRGYALRMHITRPKMRLPLDRKLTVARNLLEALHHVHAHNVVHRNLHPGNIMIGAEERTIITHFEYARARHDATLTIAREIVDDLDKHYQAPECFGEPESASPASDMFSTGLVLFELFTHRPAFQDPTEIFDREGAFKKRPSEFVSDLPPGLDGWLQRLCAFDPDDRPDAKTALESFEAIVGG